MPEIKLASDDNSCVVAIVSNGEKNCINPMAIVPLMKKKGFLLSPVQNPAGMHISMTLAIAKKWKDLVKALKESIKEIKKDPSLNSNKTIATYGLTANIPDGNFV